MNLYEFHSKIHHFTMEFVRFILMNHVVLAG